MIFLNQLEILDQKLTLAINSFNSPVTDAVWQLFSWKELWFAAYAVLAYFLLRRLGWKNGVLAILALALSVLACDQFANLIKNSACRLRPVHNELMLAGGLHVLEGPGSMYGYFSAHAANAMSLAICSTRIFRTDKSHKYGAYAKAIMIWAVLVGISRIFVGKHFLGDVITGFAAGAAAGLLFSEAFKRLFHRHAA